MAYLLPLCRKLKIARLGIGDSEFWVNHWAYDAGVWAAVTPVGVKLTAANIRGALTRNYKRHGYVADFLQHEPDCFSRQTIVLFLLHKLPESMMLKQKPMAIRAWAPPVEMRQLELELA